MLSSLGFLFRRFLRAVSPAVLSASDEVLDQLQNRIDYRFKDPSLLVHAVTHRSHVDSEDKKRIASNERLEFLGDSVLNCLVTEHLYLKYADKSEGELSKMKSLLVSRKIIGEVGASIDLGYYMIMGLSERKSGGRERMSIISNAFEALLGAIFLDSGFPECRAVLEKLLFPHINRFVNDNDNINYKSKILELSQHDGFGIPSYPVISEKGPDHSKTFVVGVKVSGILLGEGEGANKKLAQQNAARVAVENYDKVYIQERIKSAGENQDE